jgi:D-alanyl-D-alanine carboxypeptidase
VENGHYASCGTLIHGRPGAWLMLKRRTFIGLAASATLAPTFAHVGAREHPAPADLDKNLTRLADLAALVGASVTVASHGKKIGFWSRGMASLPFSVPVTGDTLFHAGSIGKHFTSSAVLQLAEAGSIDLRAPVGRYLADIPKSWSDRSLYSLLTHTSGIPELDYDAFVWDRPNPREEILAAMADKPPIFDAGQTWHYSNPNYMLLGWVIEAVSGRTYGDYLAARVFAAAGLPTARLDAAGDIIRNRAEPYFPNKGRLEHATRMESAWSADASGGVLLSSHDLAPWTQALLGARVISPSSFKSMTTAAVLSTGQAVPYGFGMGVEQTQGVPLYRHTGSVPGFVCIYKVLPTRGLSVLVMTNSSGQARNVIQSMAVTALEHFAPGSTFASLPSQKGDSAATRAAQAVLGRSPDTPPPADALTPAVQMLFDRVGQQAASRADKLETIAPVESWRVSGGKMVRYRASAGGIVTYPAVGHTKDGRIFWI